MNASKHQACKIIAKAEKQIQEQRDETLLLNCIQAWRKTTQNKTPRSRRKIIDQARQETSKKYKRIKTTENIQLIKKKWGGREIQILTDEIRENAENRNMRQVWPRINQLKSNQTATKNTLES